MAESDLALTYEDAVAFYARTYQPDPIIVPLRGQSLSMWGWEADAVIATCDRAQAAFLRHLTPSQRRYWTRWHWCWVTAPSGTRYKLRDSWCWNITEYEGEKPQSRWCLSTHGDCPAEDRYLTQLLYLRYNEAEFRKVANEDPYV